MNKTKDFCSNKVETARYSILSWIPKNIFFQCIRLNNLYYLVLVILCFFTFSPKNPFALTALFLSVLLFSLIKDGIEDIWRHIQDREVNLRKVLKFCLDSKSFKFIHSQDVKVGNVIKIQEHEEFPADCILLVSSNLNGTAYLNTISLDGENSLKEKKRSQSLEGLKGEEEISEFQATFHVDFPNPSLVTWNANLEIGKEVFPLNSKQLLLRGCTLKNTDWVLAIVVYTGMDCKIVLNSKKAQMKTSELQQKMNRIVGPILILLVSFSMLFGGLGKDWYENNDVDDYIDQPSSYQFREFIFRSLAYWIIFAPVIPISLYVVIEIQRLILCSFISNDLEMYNQETDRRSTWRCSDIVEQMGKVEYIFSDKTGTLTKNEMELMKISIQRKIYDLKADEHNIKKCLADESQTSFCSFFDLLLLCSTVFPTEHEGKTVLNSVSPDDMALATAAQLFGLSLIEKNEKFIKICKDGKEETWKVLAEIPFSSERKKMTVIVENEKGESFLFTKGADMVILPMIKTLDDLTNGTLLNFAREGLRTLVMAGKKLSKKKLDSWLQEYQQIMIGNSPSKDEDLDTLSIKIEKKLELFGVSAIEDKLQEGVPEAISLLTKANIRIWMITGDKEETAEEIAKSCNLLSNTSELIQLYNSDFESIKSKLKELHSKYINKTCNYSELEEIREAVNLSISMNGIALSFILQSEEIKKEFFQLAYIAKTCICCRMSPAQKSEIVKLCRSQGTWTTLAVGDGANDVAMIQEAHVGIGVAGKEGTQAMLAAEYTISQFSHLTRMLLVHGRYSYIRMSKFINYNFYKNFISCFCEGWLAFYCGYSGQLYFLDWIPPFYSFFWTSWPCLAFFSLEQDVSPSQSMIYPNLYTAGQKNAYFSIKIFLGWNFLAFLSATFIFWLSASSLDGGIGPDGHEPTLFWMTNTSMMILVHTINLKLIICISFILFYVLFFMLSSPRVAYRFQPEFPGMVGLIISHGKTWVIIILGSFVALIPDYIYEFVKLTFFPDPTDKIVEYLNRQNQVTNSQAFTDRREEAQTSKLD